MAEVPEQISGDLPDVEKFNMYATKLGLDKEIAKDLYEVRNYDIFVIADDSGSMLNSVGGFKTRWDELRENLGNLFT